MAMQIRPDYVNPLTMTADKKGAQRLGQPAAQKGEAADRVAELQAKQQQLQNHMLLLKAAGTDSAGTTAETQKVVEAELEKVAAELRTAKGRGAQAVEPAEQTRLNAQPTTVRRSMDLYEPEKGKTASPGIYRVEEDSEQGYKISFSPYSEE